MTTATSTATHTRRGLGTAALAVAVLTTLLFLLGFAQGVTAEGLPLLHELAHDARHLLGVPCH